MQRRADRINASHNSIKNHPWLGVNSGPKLSTVQSAAGLFRCARESLDALLKHELSDPFWMWALRWLIFWRIEAAIPEFGRETAREHSLSPRAADGRRA